MKPAQLPLTHSEPLSEDALFAELDAIARECPELAQDQAQHRDDRQTERPQAPGEWSR